MPCTSTFFCNLISLIPDGETYQLTPASLTGWHVLYPPSSSSNSHSVPVPVYHISGTDKYSGWTSYAPLNCNGNTNYPTGRCQLVYTRVEESPTIWTAPNQPATHKTDISLVGRTVKPKVFPEIFDYPETFCFYTTRQERNPVFFDIIEKWNLGHVSYRQIPGQVLVSEKVFGTPIAADLRTIGRYRSVVESYGLTNQIDEDGLNMPEVVEN